MKVDEFAKERPLAMHGVERLGLRAADHHALLRDDAQSRFLDHRVDRAGQIAGRGIGFDDRKCTLDRHQIILWEIAMRRKCAAYSGRSPVRQAGGR
jgi:hypothetical protein